MPKPVDWQAHGFGERTVTDFGDGEFTSKGGIDAYFSLVDNLYLITFGDGSTLSYDETTREIKELPVTAVPSSGQRFFSFPDANLWTVTEKDIGHTSEPVVPEKEIKVAVRDFPAASRLLGVTALSVIVAEDNRIVVYRYDANAKRIIDREFVDTSLPFEISSVVVAGETGSGSQFWFYCEATPNNLYVTQPAGSANPWVVAPLSFKLAGSEEQVLALGMDVRVSEDATKRQGLMLLRTDQGFYRVAD